MKVRELIAQLQDDIDPEANVFVAFADIEQAVEAGGEWVIDAFDAGRDDGGAFLLLMIR